MNPNPFEHPPKLYEVYSETGGFATVMMQGWTPDELVTRLNNLLGLNFEFVHQFSNVWTYRRDRGPEKTSVEISVEEFR